MPGRQVFSSLLIDGQLPWQVPEALPWLHSRDAPLHMLLRIAEASACSSSAADAANTIWSLALLLFAGPQAKLKASDNSKNDAEPEADKTCEAGPALLAVELRALPAQPLAAALRTCAWALHTLCKAVCATSDHTLLDICNAYILVLLKVRGMAMRRESHDCFFLASLSLCDVISHTDGKLGRQRRSRPCVAYAALHPSEPRGSPRHHRDAFALLPEHQRQGIDCKTGRPARKALPRGRKRAQAHRGVLLGRSSP